MVIGALAAPGRVPVVGRVGEAVGRGLERAAFGEDLDAALGLLEPAVAVARQRDAPFVQLERLLQREFAFFELLDDRLEFGDRRLRSP